MSDEEDEEMEEEMDIEESSSAPSRAARNVPIRRVPRRAASTDGSTMTPAPPPPSVRRGGPQRARSTESGGGGGGGGGGSNSNSNTTGPAMRRTRTDGSERKGRRPLKDQSRKDNSTSNRKLTSSRTNSPTRGGAAAAADVRSSTSTGVGRFLPGRTKSALGRSIGNNRSAPRRTASGFGAPRRVKSSDGTSSSTRNSLAVMRRSGRKKDKAGLTEDSMNIFGSDMVSPETVIEEIEQAKMNPNLRKLELEDFFIAEREHPEQIAEVLAELFESDELGHVWENVTFTDDIIDGAMYGEFKDRKRKFLRAMGGVFERRLIPVTYKSKITVSSGSLSLEEIIELLFYLRGDKSVVELTLKSNKVDQSMIRALTELFRADKRKWSSVIMQLSGSGPGKPGSPEHTEWAQQMQAATEDMQKVCAERGIQLE